LTANVIQTGATSLKVYEVLVSVVKVDDDDNGGGDDDDDDGAVIIVGLAVFI
jgi:hypothetical protein